MDFISGTSHVPICRRALYLHGPSMRVDSCHLVIINGLRVSEELALLQLGVGPYTMLSGGSRIVAPGWSKPQKGSSREAGMAGAHP